MITNTGKEIIGKFLLGQAPEFATHIAVGCGAQPLFPNQTLDSESVNDLKERQTLEFEAFRVPITSKGFIKEQGVEKIVFKAEMPTEQRYQVSEVGFYPSAANSTAGAYDSKALSVFTPTESWVIYSQDSSSNILAITDNSVLADASANFITDDLAFYISSDATVFDNEGRKLRQEPTRFYTNALAVSGSASRININPDNSFSVGSASYRVENSSLAFNLSQNLPTDQIKLAFSVISKQANNDTAPDKVRVILDFVNNLPGLELESPKARLGIEIDQSDFDVLNTGQSPDPQNRYRVITRTLSQFNVDDTFSWANINLTRLYACALDSSDNLLDTYYIAFDGLRLENISSDNPLYGLVGYNVIRSDFAYPILKAQNTNNFVEYRFGIGVDV
ncbi:MAG: hypothetical protein O3B35_04715 [Proteobacteria bacterium]|nr:hypothetical protein [Pseudomonadota bacterium]